MDKYQKFILDRAICSVSSDNSDPKDATQAKFSELIRNGVELVINQVEDYRIRKNYLFIVGDAISSVIVDGKTYIPAGIPSRNPLDGTKIVMPIDFDSPAKEMKIVFLSKMAHDLNLRLCYVEADREKFDAKIRDELSKRIRPDYNTGPNLINIYWDKASEAVVSVRLSIYAVLHREQERMVGQYTFTDEVFKSITGLASGDYYFEIAEYDVGGSEIAKTEKIKFSISDAVYGRPRPCNIIS